MMKRRTSFTALAAAALALGLAATAYAQQTTLRVFSGGANQRPDLMRKLFDQYQAKNPNVKIEIETGGATSELQRQYLSTVLNAKDPAIDIYLIDIVNPAQYYGAGWLEPLDAYVGKPADVLKPYLPVYAHVERGRRQDRRDAGLRRRDVHVLPQGPARQARRQGADRPGTSSPPRRSKIQKAEGNANLQGLSIQGAPIEGAVCTFLLPYWGQGKDFNDASGKMTLDKAAATKGLTQWLSMVDAGRDQEERRRGQDARHRQRVQGRPGGVRDQLGLCLGPLQGRRRLAGQGQGRRDAAAGDGRRQERHLRRRLAMGGERVLARTSRPRRTWSSTCRAPSRASSWRSKARCWRPTRASTPTPT